MSEVLRKYSYARSLLGSVLIILAHVYSEPSAWSFWILNQRWYVDDDARTFSIQKQNKAK